MSVSILRLALAVIGGGVGTALIATPAAAQTSAPRWELGVHVGYGLGTHSTAGSSRLPPAGATFTTVTGAQSRRTASWYFGDGASMFNQIVAAFSLPISPITPLDAVLGTSGAERRNGADLGFRLSRRIRHRLALEASIDTHVARLAMSSEAAAGVDASVASFADGWNAFLGAFPSTFTNVKVTSTSALDRPGRQILAAGVLRRDLGAVSGLTPYFAVGAGALVTQGSGPGATLTGNYQFRFADVAPMHETDTVHVRYTPSKTLELVFGGGVTHDFSPRSGWRADARTYVGRNAASVSLSANPAVAVQTPVNTTASFTTPSLQFSNGPSTGAQSSLTGSALANVQTFRGSGTEIHLTLTVGYFRRF